MTDPIADSKIRVAASALKFIKDGMVIGLGTGSTTKIAIDFIGAEIKAGRLKNIVGVPTSEATAGQAKALGITLGNLADYPQLDVAIDGADEVDPNFNLMKGWGGALMREKLVELYARRFIVIVDESKLVQQLATRGPLPVEVVPFAWDVQAQWLEKILACRVSRRIEENGKPYITDNGNYILNCHFLRGIANPAEVEAKLAGRPGIVGHGLFLNMATDVLVAGLDGIKHLQR